MAETNISWCDYTSNCWEGCMKVSPACDHCYAETNNNRYYAGRHWGKQGPRRDVGNWKAKINEAKRAAIKDGHKKRVFIASLADIFEKPMPLLGSDGVTILDDIDTGFLRRELFVEIDNGKYPNLMFLFLTKRPSNINKYIPENWKEGAPVNVMFGTSPVSQKTFDTLIPQLLQVNGKRFLSMEPQLEQIILTNKLTNREVQGIDWIIQGGESGHHRRPFDTDWAYSMYNQCVGNGIPYFFKQIDKVIPVPNTLMIREFPI